MLDCLTSLTWVLGKTGETQWHKAKGLRGFREEDNVLMDSPHGIPLSGIDEVAIPQGKGSLW